MNVWSAQQNLKQFMTQTILNGHQARWLLQLAPYDFTIHYHKGSLNPADGPSHRPDYLEEQEAVEQTAVGKLMPSLVNKLATAATIRAGVQCQVKGHDPYTESLIRVLSLQATTQSAARSAADDLGPFPEVEPNEALTNHEVEPSEALDNQEAKFSTLTMSKEKSSILELIQNAQELDPQCRRISSQLCDLSLEDPSLTLALQQCYSKAGLIRDLGRVLVPPQVAIRNELVEV